MKHPAALLTASVAANLFLCGLMVVRAPSRSETSADVAMAGRGAPGDRPESSVTTRDADGILGPEGVGAIEADTDRTLWKQLHDEDPAAFEKRMRAAGLPEHAVSALLAAEARERVRKRQPTAESPSDSPGSNSGRTRRNSAGATQGGTVRAVALADSNGGPLGRNFEFIAPARREAARTVALDYDAMIADVRRGGSILTDSEKQMITILESERHRDLESILTPQELADFEIFKSPIHGWLSYQTQYLKPTLEEFRTIYALEKEYSDRFASVTHGALPGTAERTAAEQFRATVNDQLLLALGTERFEQYERSRIHEYRELSNLIQRNNLPATKANDVFDLRGYVAEESNLIFDDHSLSVAEKRAALQSLATDMRAQVLNQLGDEAGTAYLKLADGWLKAVEQGSAVTFRSINSTFYRRLPTSSPPTPDGG